LRKYSFSWDESTWWFEIPAINIWAHRGQRRPIEVGWRVNHADIFSGGQYGWSGLFDIYIYISTWLVSLSCFLFFQNCSVSKNYASTRVLSITLVRNVWLSENFHLYFELNVCENVANSHDGSHNIIYTVYKEYCWRIFAMDPSVYAFLKCFSTHAFFI
jgi:hypothetical protein